MKSITRILSGFALGVVLAGAGAAGAQAGPGGGGPGFGMHRGPMERTLGAGLSGGRWWNNPKVIEQLKLTDDQRKDMDQILLQHREGLIDLRASLEKAELAMEPLMNADQPNEQAVLAQIDQIAQARAELEKANARFLLAIRAKLTPDQYKQLKAWRADQGDGDDRRMWRNRSGAGNPGGRRGSGDQPAPQGGPGAPPPAGPDGPQSMLPLPPGEGPDAESLPVPDAGTIP